MMERITKKKLHLLAEELGLYISHYSGDGTSRYKVFREVRGFFSANGLTVGSAREVYDFLRGFKEARLEN